MASRRKTEEPAPKRRRPATTPEAREQELVGLAYDLAEQQLKAGTASSQMITHLMKAGSVREELEQMRIAHEIELARVKRESMEKADRMETLMEDAITAMRSYQGAAEGAEYEDYED